MAAATKLLLVLLIVVVVGCGHAAGIGRANSDPECGRLEVYLHNPPRCPFEDIREEKCESGCYCKFLTIRENGKCVSVFTGK